MVWIKKKLVNLLQTVERRKNITQKQLADKFGVTDKAISKWENGRCLMDISFLVPVSEILEVSVLEIINDERVIDKNILCKSDEVLVNTLEYAQNKVQKNVIYNKIITFILILIIVIGIYFIYKSFMLVKYYSEPLDNYQEMVDMYKENEVVKIYKKTIDEKQYFEFRDIKIRNDFKDYQLTDEFASSELELYRNKYSLYDDLTGDVLSTFQIGEYRSEVDFLSSISSMLTFDTLGPDEEVDIEAIFNERDIDDDIDLFNYIANNYYLENSLFDSVSDMKENYVINSFSKVMLANITNLVLIEGDYRGYIFNADVMRQAVIFKNDRVYIFMFNRDKVTDEYIIDLISTLEIK